MIEEGSGKGRLSSGEEAREDGEKMLGKEAVSVKERRGRILGSVVRRERVDFHAERSF